MTFGQTHRYLARRSAVHLRRTAGSRSPTTRWTSKVELKQLIVHQFVQVELGHVLGDPYACGGTFSTDRLGLRRDELVEITAHRLGQRSDAGHPRRQVV